MAGSLFCAPRAGSCPPPRCYAPVPQGTWRPPLRSGRCLPVVASLLPPGTALMRLRFAQKHLPHRDSASAASGIPPSHQFHSFYGADAPSLRSKTPPPPGIARAQRAESRPLRQILPYFSASSCATLQRFALARHGNETQGDGEQGDEAEQDILLSLQRFKSLQ